MKFIVYCESHFKIWEGWIKSVPINNNNFSENYLYLKSNKMCKISILLPFDCRTYLISKW
jgi:hypothetical protein